jgi:hypothetical protein
MRGCFRVVVFGFGSLFLIGAAMSLVIRWRQAEFEKTPAGKEAAAQRQREAAADAARRAEEDRFGSSSDACIKAHHFVRAALKFPDDASFPWFDGDATKTVNGEHWHVRGKVVAKNAFGAELTRPYFIELCKQDGMWRANLIRIGDDIAYVDPAIVKTVADGLATEAERERPRHLDEPEPDFDTRMRAARERESRKRNAALDESRRQEQVTAAQLRSDQDLAEKKLRAKRIADAEDVSQKAAEDLERWRTWSADEGKFSIEAKFIMSGAGKVTLEKKDGSRIEVAVDRLAQKDRDWISAWSKRRK